MGFLDSIKSLVQRLGARAGSGLEEVGLPQLKRYTGYERALGEAIDDRVAPLARDLLKQKSVVEGLASGGKSPTLEALLGDPEQVSKLRAFLKSRPEVMAQATNNRNARELIAGLGAGGVMAGTAYAGKKLMEGGEPKRAGLKVCGPESEAGMDHVKQARTAAFKVGFLRKLAEIGAQPQEFMHHLKEAQIPFLDSVFSGAIGTGRDVVGGGLGLLGEGAKLTGEAALLAPFLVGAATGTTSAMLSSPSMQDIESLRKSEILNLYRQLTREVQARNARRAAV